MKICFIDDDLRMTYKVMIAMKAYYDEHNLNEKLECSMILMDLDLDGVREETLNYYKKLFEDSKFVLKICKKLEMLDQNLEGGTGDNILYMVDLFMTKNENKKMQESKDYKCVSMICMDKLVEKGLRYKWYSAYLESAFKDEWQRRYRRLYDKNIPKIYERNHLIQGYFKKEMAKEILEA